MRKLLPCILVAFAVSLVACTSDKQKSVRTGDKFMKAILVDIDFNTLLKYSVGEAAATAKETYNELGTEGIAELRKEAGQTKARFKLDETRSIFGKSVTQLVYEVRLGPDYSGCRFVQLELMNHRGVWRVSYYTL